MRAAGASDHGTIFEGVKAHEVTRHLGDGLTQTQVDQGGSPRSRTVDSAPRAVAKGFFPIGWVSLHRIEVEELFLGCDCIELRNQVPSVGTDKESNCRTAQ